MKDLLYCDWVEKDCTKVHLHIGLNNSDVAYSIDEAIENLETGDYFAVAFCIDSPFHDEKLKRKYAKKIKKLGLSANKSQDISQVPSGLFLPYYLNDKKYGGLKILIVPHLKRFRMRSIADKLSQKSLIDKFLEKPIELNLEKILRKI